jgi:hypothetical protein
MPGFRFSVCTTVGFDLIQAENIERRLLSIANLDSAKLPTISIPVALSDETADRLFDVNRFWRIIDRRRLRRSRPCCQGAA